ncbi:LamG-like jellyroll fold domain-containing protein [Halalkalicoccus tibetensis]|uniref:LamG-like jellyroll fold domain-containing protein n=1 Tax=Halalkalicoccus tibetensis TaxID=175632 RepID=A0ABD5VB93_9EURY
MKLAQNRRRFLSTLGTSSVVFTAGCIGQSDTKSDDNANPDETPSNEENESKEDDEPDSPERIELKWSTSSDWDNAQEREGVMNINVGGRNAESLALGYDPTADRISEFDAFWPLDEDDPDADTFVDALGSADLSHDPERWGFTDDIDPSTPGLLGGTSVEFSGDDAILHEGLPIDPSENWTMGLWVWFDGPEDQPHSNAMMLESVTDDEALGLMPNVDPPAFKIGSVNNTPGSGTEIERQQWHFHVIRYQASDTRVQGYLDGEFDYSIQPEDDSEEWIPELHDVTLGHRRVSSMDKIFNGRLDSAWMTQGLLSEDDIRWLYNITNKGEGKLTTMPKQAPQQAVNLKAAADIPDKTTVLVTIHQDITGNGTSDTSQTVDISDGANSYELDGFKAIDGGTYWTTIELKTDDRETTPRVESVIVR